MSKNQYHEKTCLQCGARYKRKNQSKKKFLLQKYCSNVCRGLALRKSKEKVDKKDCLHCGEIFERPTYDNRGYITLIPHATWKKRKYCSLSCASSVNTKKKRKKRSLNVPRSETKEYKFDDKLTVRKMTDEERRRYGI